MEMEVEVDAATATAALLVEEEAGTEVGVIKTLTTKRKVH